MWIKRRSLMAGLAAVAIIGGGAIAAGMFPGLPIVGGAAYCVSNLLNPLTGVATGACNGPTTPAGPAATTGVELFPADTQLASGQSPQTVLVPSPLIGSINAKTNRLIGGDFGTNLWQRGTTPVSAASPSTTVIGADRWAVYSSGNVVTVTKQTGAADTLPTIGLYASMRVSRPSGTNATQICTGQILDKQAAAALIGNNGVFSFYALAGAGLSAVATNRITATLAYWTAADSATPLANTDTFMKGTITGYVAAVGGASNGTTATVASGIATIPISTTWTRYSVYGRIPATNAAGTAVTGVGVTICYTPASGTGGSTEWFEIAGAQLQAMPYVVSATMPNGVTAPTGFQRRTAYEEALLQFAYTWGPGQEVIGLKSGVYALCVATGNVDIGFWPPVPMYIEPTTATSVLTAGTYSIQTAATVVGIGTMNITASSATNKLITLNSNAACTTTLPYTFVGGAGATGLILFVAEP